MTGSHTGAPGPESVLCVQPSSLENGSSPWAPATHTGNLESVPASQPQPQLGSPAGIWVSQPGWQLSVSLRGTHKFSKLSCDLSGLPLPQPVPLPGTTGWPSSGILAPATAGQTRLFSVPSSSCYLPMYYHTQSPPQLFFNIFISNHLMFNLNICALKGSSVSPW